MSLLAFLPASLGVWVGLFFDLRCAWSRLVHGRGPWGLGSAAKYRQSLCWHCWLAASSRAARRVHLRLECFSSLNFNNSRFLQSSCLAISQQCSLCKGTHLQCSAPQIPQNRRRCLLRGNTCLGCFLWMVMEGCFFLCTSLFLFPLFLFPLLSSLGNCILSGHDIDNRRDFSCINQRKHQRTKEIHCLKALTKEIQKSRRWLGPLPSARENDPIPTN